MDSKKILERSEYLLKQMALYEHKDKVSGTFSGGMKQRLSLAASIMSNPKILFMDEPTTGLDPQSRIAIRELTESLNKQGMTIIYTTHDMGEAEKICHRIVIMDRGKVIADGTADELKHKIMSGHLIEVELESEPKELSRELKKLPFVIAVEHSGKIINITVKDKEGVFFILSEFFKKRGLNIQEIKYKEPSLEEVFINLTKKDLRD